MPEQRGHGAVPAQSGAVHLEESALHQPPLPLDLVDASREPRLAGPGRAHEQDGLARAHGHRLDALDHAVEDHKVYVLPDVSGSMSSPVTGYRKGATMVVRCVDVAALVAAAVMRKNSQAEVLAFDTRVHAAGLSPRDSVLTNAERLARFGGGGTSVSLPLAELNRRKTKGDLVIYVSDNESWVDSQHRGATATMVEWAAFKRRNPQARLVCIDIQPYGHAQAQERSDILNVGGFSDAVFEVIALFARDELNAAHWVGLIEAVDL